MVYICAPCIHLIRHLVITKITTTSRNVQNIWGQVDVPNILELTDYPFTNYGQAEQIFYRE